MRLQSSGDCGRGGNNGGEPDDSDLSSKYSKSANLHATWSAAGGGSYAFPLLALAGAIGVTRKRHAKRHRYMGISIIVLSLATFSSCGGVAGGGGGGGGGGTPPGTSQVTVTATTAGDSAGHQSVVTLVVQ
jgi:hypothetical protein